MANTYILIASQTLLSSAATITLSSIPSTYKDLMLYISARTDNNANQNVSIRFNGDSATNYSTRRLYSSNGGGTAADSTSGTSAGGNTAHLGSAVGNNNSAMLSGNFGATFNYIANYSDGSAAKTIASTGGFIDTSSSITASREWTGGYWSATAAISSITLLPYQAGTNFITGTTVSLFGIG